jgi:hypothetical protein
MHGEDKENDPEKYAINKIEMQCTLAEWSSLLLPYCIKIMSATMKMK